MFIYIVLAFLCAWVLFGTLLYLEVTKNVWMNRKPNPKKVRLFLLMCGPFVWLVTLLINFLKLVEAAAAYFKNWMET